MVTFIFGVLFSGLMLLAVGLWRTYNHFPAKELKRRARGGDPIAELLYKPVSYGMSLQVLLGLIVLISASIAFVLLSRTFADWFAVIIIAFLLWLGFLWLPTASLTSASLKLAEWLSPPVAWLVSLFYPILRWIGDFFTKYRRVNIRSGLFEKEDLIELLEKQREMPDNRISDEDIDILLHALTFGDILVRDAMVPKRVVKSVDGASTISPALMDELYQSGHSRFPVYEGEENHIVGTLFLRDLVRKEAHGLASSLMRKDVYFVHEDFTLQQALQALLRTKHHLYIVVNSFEEYVGILTTEDILERVIGQPIIDEFDNYDDIRAVAAAAASKEHSDRKKNGQESTTTPEQTEVVE